MFLSCGYAAARPPAPQTKDTAREERERHPPRASRARPPICHKSLTTHQTQSPGIKRGWWQRIRRREKYVRHTASGKIRPGQIHRNRKEKSNLVAPLRKDASEANWNFRKALRNRGQGNERESARFGLLDNSTLRQHPVFLSTRRQTDEDENAPFRR